MTKKIVGMVLGAALAVVTGAGTAGAHCDTMDGPVIRDAQAALAAGDITPVLKWVHPGAEAELRESFRQVMAVRALGPEARQLADRAFFETLVRLHRAGEGAPYTGIKAAGVEMEPGIAAADRALEAASVEALVKMTTAAVERGLRERYARTAEARKKAGDSVAAGREYVAAYVDFVHFAERLHADATSGAAAHAAAEDGGHRH
jgi:hypothetical protein